MLSCTTATALCIDAAFQGRKNNLKKKEKKSKFFFFFGFFLIWVVFFSSSYYTHHIIYAWCVCVSICCLLYNTWIRFFFFSREKIRRLDEGERKHMKRRPIASLMRWEGRKNFFLFFSSSSYFGLLFRHPFFDSCLTPIARQLLLPLSESI